jgi:hypothetical protein
VGEQESQASAGAGAVDEIPAASRWSGDGSCACFASSEHVSKGKTIMRIVDLDTSASVGSDCETLDQELVHDLGLFSDDELNDDQFFTMLESLLTHGTGALVLVR